MIHYRIWLAMSAIALLLTGCASTQTQSTYPSVSGVIISMQPMTQAGSGKIGMLAGAAAGGFGGSTLTHNKKAQVVDAAAGAVVGALIGDMAEHAMTRKQGMEYLVKTDNGTVVKIDQTPNPALQINQRVVIIYQNNGQPQLIPDNSRPQERMEVHHYHHHHYYKDDNYDDGDED